MPPAPPPTTEVRSPVHAGQVVDGKYKVDGVLGAGGMGIVVSAMHLTLEEPVALKFMTLGEGRGDTTTRARFLREAKAARKLTSAHVARVFDVGQLPTGEPFIVMELLRGTDLAKHLKNQGRLSPAETVHHMLEVCDAIREAHALGIIHRDLKPQNMFLAERPGGQSLIKVLDFGIAKSLETSETDPSLTTSQNVVGSPVYMSPEQLRASKHVDGRTDIWSLGVIMFELLTGGLPFAGDSVMELGMRIMTAPAPKVADLRDDVPVGLAEIVGRCLEKDPEARFATATDLATALKRFEEISQRSLPFAQTAHSQHPPSWPPSLEQLRTGGEFAKTKGTTVRPPRRRAWVWGLAVPAVIVAVVALRFWPTPPAGSARPSPAPPAAAPSTYHVALRATPPTARLRLDGETAQTAPFARELLIDGKPHSIVVEADGFEPVTLSFRDAPPPDEITLKALPPPEPPPTATAKPTHALAKPPPPRVTAPPPPASTPPPKATPPTSTNDSPIIR
jgi:eukaryotic-like serine/threonine-protein kinase